MPGEINPKLQGSVGSKLGLINHSILSSLSYITLNPTSLSMPTQSLVIGDSNTTNDSSNIIIGYKNSVISQSYIGIILYSQMVEFRKIKMLLLVEVIQFKGIQMLLLDKEIIMVFKLQTAAILLIILLLSEMGHTALG